jgi:hypothetical protein
LAERADRVEHYRRKAEEVRTIADNMGTQEPREILIGVAIDYLMLALMLERTSIPDPIPASE